MMNKVNRTIDLVWGALLFKKFRGTLPLKSERHASEIKDLLEAS